MRAFAHDVWRYPLPPGHRFPQEKYRLVREAAERLPRVQVAEAPAAAWDELSLTHAGSYLERVAAGTLDRREVQALGLPWSPDLVERSRRSTGATVVAARAALEDGIAMNLGGGTHHAFADSGGGFCVFNDVVTALRVIRRERRVRRVLVVDVDVHQGDGTHALLAHDEAAFTLSLNGFRNYPFRRVPGDLDVELPDGTGDDAYLSALDIALAEAIGRSRAELAFVLAGADPYEHDRLGRLALTKPGLLERDGMIRRALDAAGAAICVTLAGGYAEDIRDTVEINLGTVRTFSR